jgi:hypothetical protein
MLPVGVLTTRLLTPQNGVPRLNRNFHVSQVYIYIYSIPPNALQQHATARARGVTSSACAEEIEDARRAKFVSVCDRAQTIVTCSSRSAAAGPPPVPAMAISRHLSSLLLLGSVAGAAATTAFQKLQQPTPPPAAAAAAPNRSCAAGATVLHQNLYGKGVMPMRTLKDRTIAQCCEACQSNADCGAYFAKVGAAAGSAGSCALYNTTEAAQLRTGQCPGSRPHTCGSAVWVGPVSALLSRASH